MIIVDLSMLIIESVAKRKFSALNFSACQPGIEGSASHGSTRAIQFILGIPDERDQ